MHSELTTDSVWPADLRTLLGLPAGNGVHVGRRPQSAPTLPLDVLIRRGPVDQVGRGGFDDLKRHNYELSLRVLRNAGPAQAGKSEQTDLDGHLRAIVDRYDGTRRFAGSLTAPLVAIEARELTPDVDPARRDQGEATVAVSFLVNA